MNKDNKEFMDMIARRRSFISDSPSDHLSDLKIGDLFTAESSSSGKNTPHSNLNDAESYFIPNDNVIQKIRQGSFSPNLQKVRQGSFSPKLQPLPPNRSPLPPMDPTAEELRNKKFKLVPLTKPVLWNVKPGLKNEVDINPEGFLRSELGVQTRIIQSQNELNALVDPTGFLKKRNKQIQKLFTDDGIVTKHFNNVYGKYRGMGLPADIARKMAVQSADKVFNEHIQILEIQYPSGYAKSFGTAKINNEAMIDQNALAMSAIPEYKTKKRAKKLLNKQ